MLKSMVGNVRGIARVKKFTADQDIEKDTPVEVKETLFSLGKKDMEQVKKGKSFAEIVNKKVTVKAKKGD